MSYRVDFFLDEPIGSAKALADFREFTRTNKARFSVDEPVLWFKTLGHNITGDRIDYTFAKIREAIEHPDQIILLWAAEHNIVLDQLLVDNLNRFAETVPNPIVFVTGVLGDWVNEWHGKLKFTLSPVSYFDFEAAHAWTKHETWPALRSKKFMCMGTKDYPNRKYLLSKIITNGLLDQGYVGYRQLASGTLAPAHYSSNDIAQIQSVASLADQHLPLPVLDSSIDYTEMPRTFMYDSYVNMITDTFFEHWGATTFISEKVFNAMLHGQMFFMMSPPGTLKYLQSVGYKTFGDVVDESYDTISDNYKRLSAVTESFLEFVNRPIDEIHGIHNKCMDILEHNRSRVLSAPLPHTLKFEFQKAINEKTQTK